jgi:hypothetical protein
MDALQTQMNDLTQKVDRLHEIVERISHQIVDLTGNFHKQSEHYPDRNLLDDEPSTHHYNSSYSRFSAAMEHKDILSDNSTNDRGFNTQQEQKLSPEIQIRRLTAQLTAAYNRIAALEEQLLTYRIRS